MDDGVGRGSNVFFGIFFVDLRLNNRRLPCHDQVSGVADPGGHAKENRKIEFLGHFIGFQDHIQGVLAVGRFEHGQLGGPCIVAVVLFILGGMHAGIVSGDNDKTLADTVVGRRKDGVGRHVQADMLHGSDRAHAGDGGSVGNLCGHLFIGCPFMVDVFVLGQVFENFCTGSSGIGTSHLHAGFEQTARNRLVPR